VPDESNTRSLALAVISLLVENRSAEALADRKSEVLLADAGMSVEDIAVALNKKPDAVRMAIRRARP
jgi:DNA-directed RNA polymerase specialized sigma24 family protein